MAKSMLICFINYLFGGAKIARTRYFKAVEKEYTGQKHGSRLFFTASPES